MILLDVRDLRAEFATRKGTVHVVHGLSFTVDRGEIVGIVGESGSGKSTAVRSIIGLMGSGGRVTGGQVLLDGEDLRGMKRPQLRDIRGRRIGFVAQNPFGALNPMLRIEQQFANVVRAHRRVDDAAINARALDLLRRTGIPDPDRVLRCYAHELSGGMAQRFVLAIAMALGPELLIADEPTTALDLTVQRQLLETLKALIAGEGTSMLLVTHDLGVVANYCHRVVVMYAGRLIEQGVTTEVFTRPRHPYTAALLRAVPRGGLAPSAVPAQRVDLIDYPVGCPYRSGCPRAVDACDSEMPEQAQISAATFVSCHHPLSYEEVGAASRAR